MKRFLKQYRAIKNLNEDLTSVLEVADKVYYDKEKPYLIYQTSIEDEVTEEDDIYGFAVQCENFIELTSGSKLSDMFSIYKDINDKGFFISYIITGSKEHFNKSLETSGDYFFNVRLFQNENLNPASVLLCCTKFKNPEPIDIKLVIKITL